MLRCTQSSDPSGWLGTLATNLIVMFNPENADNPEDTTGACWMPRGGIAHDTAP